MSSSSRWLARQRVDEYVIRAAREGFRSRAAYKLEQINAKFKPSILRKGQVALELGAAPGGWSQVMVKHGMRVVGGDLLPIEPLDGATFFKGDFTDAGVQRTLLEALGEEQRADVLLSDMSPNRSGNFSRDEAYMMEYADQGLTLASRCLRPGGSLIWKLLDGAELKPLFTRAKGMFKTSGGLFKSKASRPKSREVYLVARGFDPDAYATLQASGFVGVE